MTDPSGADHAALIDVLTKTEEQPPARTPTATVQGMPPLQRPPALPETDE